MLKLATIWCKKNPFLHGELEKEIYMELPVGYGEQNRCELKKMLHGLKQSPRVWFGRLTKVMVGLGFKQNQGEHFEVQVRITMWEVYSDDIILTSDDEEEKILLGKHLAKKFEIKSLEN